MDEWLSRQAICVTGARGVIGHAVIARLTGSSGRVVAFGAGCGAAPWPAGVVGVDGDVLDAAAVQAAVADCSVVIHLAALTHVALSAEDADAYHRINVGGTQVMAAAARCCRVEAVVLASTGHVYGRPVELPIPETHPIAPLSAYATSKWEAERILMATLEGQRSAPMVARLSNVYSHRSGKETVIGRALTGCLTAGEIRLRRLLVVRDFLHADDAARALIGLAHAAVEHRGTVVNVSSGVGVSVGDVAARVAAVARDLGLGAIPIIEEGSDESEIVPSLILDHARVHALCGWTPMIDLDAGLKDALARRRAASSQ